MSDPSPRSSMSRASLFSLVSALLSAIAACTPPPGPPAAPAAAPLAPLLAVAACPEVLGRVLTLSTAGDGIDDAFALVEHCAARPVDGDVVLSGDAWVRVAVDRDLGAVRVRQFVHASLHAELRLGVRATYVEEHLEVALTPRPGAVASIEPVGALEVSPLNWASLLAVELAPAAGTSVEWVAKRRLREETERAVAAAIARPLVFAYDAATPAVPRLRVVPPGTALLGPYPESESAPKVQLRLAPGAVAERARCVVVVPDLLHAGFIVGGRAGRGVATCREGQGWSRPSFVRLTSASAGLQAGVQSVDVVMLMMTNAGMKRLLDGKAQLGATASVAAGPVGREAQASSNVTLTAEVLYYSRASGLFVGLDLSGTVLEGDEESSRAFYGDARDFRALLRTPPEPPPAAKEFVQAIERSFSP